MFRETFRETFLSKNLTELLIFRRQYVQYVLYFYYYFIIIDDCEPVVNLSDMLRGTVAEYLSWTKVYYGEQEDN
jgi:hypothetical protein